MLKFIIGFVIAGILFTLISEFYKEWKSKKDISRLTDSLTDIDTEFDVVDLKGAVLQRTEELEQHKEAVLGDHPEVDVIQKSDKSSKSKVSSSYKKDKSPK